MFKLILFVAAVSAGPMGGPFGELEQGLNEDQKQQLHTIFKNDAWTKQQIQDQVKAIFQGIGGDVATKFNEMQTNMESKKAEMASKMAEGTATLSDAAKSLATQLQAIHQDMSLTRAQEQEKVKALFDGATDEVKNELKSAKGAAFGGPRFGPGGHFHTTTSA